MMKLTLAGLALALALCTIAPQARAQDETAGQQAPLTAAVPSGGFNCGHTSYPLYCYGIPLSNGGTIWLDSYWHAYPTPNGFLYFNNSDDMAYAPITSTTISGAYPTFTYTYTFQGNTNDGDTDTFTGTATFTFEYRKCPSNVKYCSTLTYLTSGTVTITYPHN
jgi:hypothetical protein